MHLLNDKHTMKQILILIALVFACAFTSEGQIKIGGKKLNTGKLVGAATDVAKAVTLSDSDIARMSHEAVVWMDNNNPVSAENSEYTKRLRTITDRFPEINGLPLNFKVYEVIDINAFACGDGSIRVFSSLMDVMTDDELAAIIGHEIGHVVNTDVKDAMKSAYLTSAAMKAAGSTGGVAQKLTDSQLGELTQSFMGAQFSQKQESAADDYAFEFCVKNGFDPYAMSNALQKLVDLSNGGKSSVVERMFSSHPDSAKRALRMKEKAAGYAENK